MVSPDSDEVLSGRSDEVTQSVVDSETVVGTVESPVARPITSTQLHLTHAIYTRTTIVVSHIKHSTETSLYQLSS